MFEYCACLHTDRSYEFFGTVDYGIRDIDSGMVLMYSVVNIGGQWMQLQAMAPIKFDYFMAINQAKGKNLKETFNAANKLKNMKVKVKCILVEKEVLMPMIRKDTASLPPEAQASLEAIIAETF